LAISALHLIGPAWKARKIPDWLSVLLTFHFVTAAWILFRAPNLSSAWQIATGTVTGSWRDFGSFANEHLFVLLLLLVFLTTHHLDSHARLRLAIRRLPRQVVWAALGLLWVLAITVSQGSSSNFIYFDF
jgi:alginate O-acetyltransferase complex protein AlgI